jgi:hypothetical protein
VGWDAIHPQIVIGRPGRRNGLLAAGKSLLQRLGFDQAGKLALPDIPP